jgi:hypothetical protein
MRGSYPTSYFVALTAFAVWLLVFRRELSLSALVSLLFCVLGSFSWLAFRTECATTFLSARAKWLQVGFLLTAVILLDAYLAPPGWPEVGVQIVLVLLLGLRMAGKI